METKYNIEGNKIFWNGELVRETSFSRESIGVYDNVMEFNFCKDNKNQGYIEWQYGEGDEVDDVVEIGLWFENKVLIDYDGVFELPEPAVKLLESLGFGFEENILPD